MNLAIVELRLLKFDFERGDRWWHRSEDEGVEGTLYQECWKGGHIRELHSLAHFTSDSLELDAILEHYIRRVPYRKFLYGQPSTNYLI